MNINKNDGQEMTGRIVGIDANLMMNEGETQVVMTENALETEKFSNVSQTCIDEIHGDGIDQTEHIDFNDDDSCGTKSYLELLERVLEGCRITTKSTYDKPKSLMEYRGASIVRSGNMSTIKGSAKCGKTFLTSLFSAVFNVGEYMDFHAEEGLKVLYVDTEQCPYDTQELLFRINKFIESQGKTFNEDALIMANVRAKSLEERLAILEDCVHYGGIDVVIIDGSKDFVTNINDPDQCSNLINTLLRICDIYKCSIINVIHENKKDSNARGHLGTELVNKSDVVIEMEREGHYVKVSPYLCRKKPFETFYFTILEDDDNIAIPVIGNRTEMIEAFTKSNKVKKNHKVAKTEERDKKIDKMLSKLESGKEYTIKEISDLSELSPTTCGRYVEQAVKIGKLLKTENSTIVLNR